MIEAIERKEMSISNQICHVCAFKKIDFKCPVCNGYVQYRVISEISRAGTDNCHISDFIKEETSSPSATALCE
jgi:hypothetical protein